MTPETPLLFAVGVFLVALGLLVALFRPELAERIDLRLAARGRHRRRFLVFPRKWATSRSSLRIQGNGVTVQEVET
ncbi:hypothetical protein ACFWVC_17640 [Streptomyces sp. NPDC058691]|uniref:hypothetical protein n=1 Tax=Streptomyces sp. NPDC058691 TaxID=3346601 RepID=UPI00365ECF8C